MAFRGFPLPGPAPKAALGGFRTARRLSTPPHFSVCLAKSLLSIFFIECLLIFMKLEPEYPTLWTGIVESRKL
jgi:hypothetical protein